MSRQAEKKGEHEFLRELRAALVVAQPDIADVLGKINARLPESEELVELQRLIAKCNAIEARLESQTTADICCQCKQSITYWRCLNTKCFLDLVWSKKDRARALKRMKSIQEAGSP